MTVFTVTMAGSFIRPLVHLLFGEKLRFNWSLALKFSLVLSITWFCIYFIWGWISAARFQPVLDVLDEEPLPSDLSKPELSGFVAMEYNWLMLKRTFVVFIAPEGLYGWKAAGIVMNAVRTFCEPYQEMLKEDEFIRDRHAIEKLPRIRGGFFYRAIGDCIGGI